MSSPAPSSTPVDPAQLSRIEATHRGFLYQHLFGVACLLQVADGCHNAIIIERDEDIELERTDGHWYIQVKNLGSLLQPADIADVLARFETIRELHASGSRNGEARLFIVTSTEPSPKLVEYIASADWPEAVTLVSPARPNHDLGAKAMADVVGQWRHAVELLGLVPLTRATPETLAWKLTGLIHGIATGAFGAKTHRLTSDDASLHREQFLAFVDELPEPPTPYRMQVSEPPLLSERRVRMLLGPSGSGKTAWASQAAVHSAARVIYIRAREADSASFDAWLAGHLVQHLFPSDPDARANALRSGGRGTEAVRIVDSEIRTRNLRVLVIVDDAHLLQHSMMIAAIRATTRVSWLLVGWQHEQTHQMASRLVVPIEELGGWSIATIAEVAGARGVPCDPVAASRARTVTSGVPLFVENLVQLASEERTTLGNTVAQLEAGLHGRTTTLERLLLQDVIRHLSPLSRRVMGALSTVRVALSWSVLTNVAKVLVEGPSSGSPAQALRSLRDWQVLRSEQRGYGLHDSFRLIALQEGSVLSINDRTEVSRVLCQYLSTAIQSGEASARHVVDNLRALGDLGRVDEIADIVSGWEEWFREHEMDREVEGIVESALALGCAAPETRALALDALSFLALSRKDRGAAEHYIRELAEAIKQIKKPNTDLIARLGLKHVLMARITDDFEAAAEAVRQVVATIGSTSHSGLVLWYNLAAVAGECRRFANAEQIANRVLDGYARLLGIDTGELGVLSARAERHAGRVPNGRELLRHAADAFYLIGDLMRQTGRTSPQPFLAALRLYEASDSPASSVKAALEAADAFLWARTESDPHRSVDIFESKILPQHPSPRYHLDVHSLYAVALACAGNHGRAQEVVKGLDPFLLAFSAEDQVITRRRRLIVEALLSGAVSLRKGVLLDCAGRPCFTQPLGINDLGA